MSARWYKRCGADFIHGTMMLTLEEKGAYSLCLDLIYDRGGPIPDDARWLAGVCGCSIRRWGAIRARLIELGKLTVENELISNSRAGFELVSTDLRARERAESGAKGGRQRAENASTLNGNSHLGQAELKHPPKQIREEEIRGSVSNDTDGDAVDPVKELFDAGVLLLTASGSTEKQARSLIGKWRKSRSDGDVMTGLIECRARAISEPVEWLEKRFGGVKHVSASGYEYRGSDSEIMREAERRSDWGTYWAVKAGLGQEPRPPPDRRSRRSRGTKPVGQAARAVMEGIG